MASYLQLTDMISQSRLRQKIPSFQAWKKAQKVLQGKEKQAKWVPKHINDQNSIFSSQVPHKKPMRKPGDAAIVSLNIFDLASTFKPHCIRNSMSTRSSNLFEDSQAQKEWRSSSKKPKDYPQSVQKQFKHCFKSVNKGQRNQSSLDLSWSEDILKSQNMTQSKLGRSKAEFRQQRSLFQGKRRVAHHCNSSSIGL